MHFQIKVADGKLATFNSLTELAKHYGDLGDAFRRIAENPAQGNKAHWFNKGKANAYDIICYQLSSMVILQSEPAPLGPDENIGSVAP